MPKNAIITGASSGIGAALAAQLLKRAWSLALLARHTRMDRRQRQLAGVSTDGVTCISASLKTQ